MTGTARAAAVALLGVASLCLAGCSSSTSVGLTIYNGQHVQTTQALVAAFEAKTGISVTLRSDDERVLADQIVQEGNRSPADVILTENSPALEYLSERGLLSPVDATTVAAVPARFSSGKRHWVGVSARVSVIVYNTTLLHASALPASVLDLASPAWQGRIAIAPSETDFQPIVTAVAAADGQARALQWLDGLKANAGSHVYPDNETVTNAVNEGLVSIGVINQYYWYRERAQIGAAATHSALAYFAPHDPGYVVDVSGAGILRSSAHKSAAEQFLAFVTSRQGQEILAGGSSFEYPLLAGVPPAAAETPLSQLQPYPISVGDLGDGSGATHLLQEAQLL